MKDYKFNVTCICDYMEDDETGEVWTKGRTYECQTSDFQTFKIRTNQNTTGIIGPGYLIETEEFDEYFETDFRLDLTVPTKWLSYAIKNRIYDEIRKERVIEDIESYIKDEDIKLSDDEINSIAEQYVDGKYNDCNIAYWDNIHKLISQETEIYED